MRSLPKPTDENGTLLSPGGVFDTCVSIVKRAELRSRLKKIRARVVAAARDYDKRAAACTLHKKRPRGKVGDVGGAELAEVYTARLAKKTSKARSIYDRIISAPPNSICPFCGLGTATTLDHYLPKQKFPILAVTPNNLVPACTWCQGKGEYFSITAEGSILHPYFDDFDHEVWLKAEVQEGKPAGFRFRASPPSKWPDTKKARVAAHLSVLKLDELFGRYAGGRLTEIRGRLERLHDLGGAQAVRDYLQEEAASIERPCKNSWTSAMYRAAAASAWFCDGGFRYQG